MSLETGTYISDLVVTNPTASDPKSQGDDHLRLIKSTVKTTFPNITGEVTPTHTELNYVDGVTSAIQTQLNTKSPSASPTFTGTVTLPADTSIGNVSATEVAYLDGVTSAVQTQLNSLDSLKAPKASPTFTGTVTVPTPSNSTDAATKGYADGLAFSTALPAQAGNAGKFVTTNGSIASWADAKISNVVTATTATTLTSTGTLLQITPASYGVTITLPDATTCTEGGPLHIIDNKGAYPVRVCDSTGVLKAFVFAGVVSHISLNDNSTAAGVWAIENGEMVGASAQLLNTGGFQYINNCIDLGSGKEFLIGCGTGGANIYGVVYDKASNSFGSVTLIRTATSAGNDYAAVLSAANQVLVVSCIGTAFQAVALSISGATITVNAAATATLSANLSAFADGCGLIAVGSSFVTSYTVATPAAQIRALSISGTTVTIGSASVLPGTAGGLQTTIGSVDVVTSGAGTTMYVTPYTVSGTTLTIGTQATIVSGGAPSEPGKQALLGTGNIFLSYYGATKTAVAKLAGTTVTLSDLGTTLLGGGALADAIVVGSNKVLCLSANTSNNANILTDTAGTASAGTAITLSSQTTRGCLFVNGTDAYVGEGTTSGFLQVVSCSGASPVLSRTQRNIANTISGTLASSISNSVLSRAAAYIYGTNFVQSIVAATSQILVSRVTAKGFVLWPTHQDGEFVNNGGYYRGKADSERWVSDSATVITKVEVAL
jgi:hypothetical protein